MGRPLPGSAEVHIAAYDPDAGKLKLDRGGFAIRCGADEVGMLLARVDPGEALSSTPLRGVFASEDAWLATGDLFRRDRDGDFWRVDAVRDVIRTSGAPVYTGPIRDALGDIPAIDLAVAYGVAAEPGEPEVAVAAVTVRPGEQLGPRELSRGLRFLPSGQRPNIVHVVEKIPVTTWYRPLTAPLRAAGVPEPGPGAQAWYLDAKGESYRPLTPSAHRRLVRAAA